MLNAHHVKLFQDAGAQLPALARALGDELQERPPRLLQQRQQALPLGGARLQALRQHVPERLLCNLLDAPAERVLMLCNASSSSPGLARMGGTAMKLGAAMCRRTLSTLLAMLFGRILVCIYGTCTLQKLLQGAQSGCLPLLGRGPLLQW